MSKRAKTFEREVVNTHEQIQSAGTGVAITWVGRWGRSPVGDYWCIIRFKDGIERVTDNSADAPWYAHKRKIFHAFDKKEALEEAKQWVKDTYGEEGPWVRNRMQGYVPKHINDRFPLRKDKD